MITLVFILQLLGFLCLMLAMSKHAKQAGNSRVLTKVLRLLPSPPFTKLIGWLLLTASLCLALTRIEIISIAIVWWCCTLSAALLIIAVYFSSLLDT
ncbi:DUF3325 family protein [Alteromonas sp. HB246098]